MRMILIMLGTYFRSYIPLTSSSLITVKYKNIEEFVHYLKFKRVDLLLECEMKKFIIILEIKGMKKLQN